MRNPKSPGWPDDGERTADRQVAERWKWAYHDAFRTEHRARVLGQKRARTLADAVKDYLAHRENVVEYATWSNDRSALNHVLDRLGGSTRTTKVGAGEWQGMANRMLQKGYQPSTTLVLPEWWAFHKDGDGVILNHQGRTVSTRTQRNLITRVLDTAGLNGMGRGFHELRHAYARRFLEMAPDILLLQKSLGHSSVTVTESAYGNLVPDTAAALARKRVYG